MLGYYVRIFHNPSCMFDYLVTGGKSEPSMDNVLNVLIAVSVYYGTDPTPLHLGGGIIVE